MYRLIVEEDVGVEGLEDLALMLIEQGYSCEMSFPPQESSIDNQRFLLYTTLG